MPTIDRNRVPAKPTLTTSTPRTAVATRTSTSTPSSAAIDHWSILLLYSMGIGALAVAALLFIVLTGVWMYAQFVWTFTHWDLADVSLTPFKSLAYLIIAVTFVAGSGAGMWMFTGAAWKNQKSTRASATHTRSKIR